VDHRNPLNGILDNNSISFNLDNFYLSFVSTCCFYFQGKRRHGLLHCFHLTPLLLLDRYDCRLTPSFSALINRETLSYSIVPKMQEAGCVQTSVPNCQSTERLITEECNIYEQRCGSLRALVSDIIIGIIIVNYTVCPTRYRTRHFFNNSNTNEDTATKFEQGYVRCVRNEKECVCSVCL
jgi:hypothetical protein